jgi:hypothetical protein
MGSKPDVSQTTSPSHVHTPPRIVIRCMGAVAFGRSPERRQWMDAPERVDPVSRRTWPRRSGSAPARRVGGCSPRQAGGAYGLAWAVRDSARMSMRFAGTRAVWCCVSDSSGRDACMQGLSFGLVFTKRGIRSLRRRRTAGETRPASRLLGGGGADAPCCACAARRRNPVGSPRARLRRRVTAPTYTHCGAVRAWSAVHGGSPSTLERARARAVSLCPVGLSRQPKSVQSYLGSTCEPNT